MPPPQTDYILYSGANRAIWRSNPADPYIYVSFSLEQFKNTYGNEPVVKWGIFAPHKISAVPAKKRELLKKAFEREIIERAGFPVKFLPSDAKNIKERNVCFIMQRAFDESAATDGKMNIVTLHLRENENPHDNVTPAQYKVIVLGDLNAIPTAKDIHNFLHEFLHVMEFKHFQNYNPNVDAGPFTNSLTCIDTLMAYDEFCPPVKKAEIKIFGAREVSIFSNDPKDKANIRAFENSYPTTLGSLDLEAAAVFRERWQKRNEAPQPSTSTPTIGKNPAARVRPDLFPIRTYLGKCVESAESFIYQTVDQMLTNVTKAAADYSRGLVQQCPSYFPPQSLSLQNENPGIIQNLSANATLLTLSASAPIPSTCILGLGCN